MSWGFYTDGLVSFYLNVLVVFTQTGGVGLSLMVGSVLLKWVGGFYPKNLVYFNLIGGSFLPCWLSGYFPMNGCFFL